MIALRHASGRASEASQMDDEALGTLPPHSTTFSSASHGPVTDWVGEREVVEEASIQQQHTQQPHTLLPTSVVFLAIHDRLFGEEPSPRRDLEERERGTREEMRRGIEMRNGMEM